MPPLSTDEVVKGGIQRCLCEFHEISKFSCTNFLVLEHMDFNHCTFQENSQFSCTMNNNLATAVTENGYYRIKAISEFMATFHFNCRCI